MIYFYDDIDATNSIRISNSEIAELDLVAKIKESDLDKYFKKYLKKDTNVWFYYDLSDLAEDYDCQYVQNDEFGLWYTDENKKHNDIWKEFKKTVRKSLKESYPNYDVDDVYKELKRLCDKGKNVFSEFYVERDENAFVVSISDDSSYIKLKDFIPYNIHYNENSFYMYYDNDSTYMTIFANYEDENAINVLVEVVRSLASLKGVHDKCETVSAEIVNQVSNLY